MKAMVLLKKLLNSWFDEFFSVREFVVFPHCASSVMQHKRYISWNQLSVKVSYLIWRNFYKLKNTFTEKKISWNQLSVYASWFDVIFKKLWKLPNPIVKCFHDFSHNLVLLLKWSILTDILVFSNAVKFVFSVTYQYVIRFMGSILKSTK